MTLYAAARIGVVAAFVHPLSTARELAHYLDATGATTVISLDFVYPTLSEARPKKPINLMLLGRIGDYLGPLKRLAFNWTRGRQIEADTAEIRAYAGGCRRWPHRARYPMRWPHRPAIRR